MRTTICILLAILAHGAFAQPNTWTPETDLDGDARQLAVSFSIGNKIYVGTGTDASLDGKTDFWEYDPGTGDWTQKSDFEGASRFGAIGFSINGKGYIALGAADQGAGVYKDVWEYDPASDPGPNAWVQKTDFEGAARMGAVVFVVGGKAYAGTGQGLDGNMDPIYFNDLWEFDPVANDWTQKSNLPAAARNFAVGFAIGTRGYIGTGSDANENALGDLWQYSPAGDSWVQRADLDGGPRFNAVGFSMNGLGYIGTGADGIAFNDFWEYSPASNSWTQRANFGGSARISATGTSVNGKGYVGTGIFTVNKKDLYEYTPESEAFAGKMYVTLRGPGSGVIFNADASGNSLGVIYSFDGTSGSAPTGGVIAVNGKLYGTTASGGLNDHGVLYEYNLTNSAFAKLQDLSPHITQGSFNIPTLAGGKLYGLSKSGSVGGGILFEYDFSSASFTKKLTFNGDMGQEPNGDLLLVGDKLYGLLMHGGANGLGTLFEYDFRTNTFTKKVDFNGANGSMPFGSLTEYDGLLYGMTNSGGASNAGTLFEYNPSTGILTKKKDLGGSNGANPHGSLTVLNGKLYGLTRIGGNGWGALIEFDPATGIFQKVFDMNPFASPGTGQEPRGTLTAINGRLYGLNSTGGPGGSGVLFEYDPTTGFTNKTEFSGGNGDSPWGQVTFVRDNQTLSFTPPPDKLANDAPFQLTATGSLGLPVSFYSDNNEVATISGSTVTIVGAGVATITASIGRNNHFTVAKHQLLVTKVNQAITFNSLSNKTFGDAAFALDATSNSALAVVYSSSNTNVATISGNTVTIVGGGSTTITASQPGNSVYNAASTVDRTLTVAKAGQTITFNALVEKDADDPDFNLTATATSNLTVSYNSSNTSVATISGSTVSIVGVGSTTITASQAGNGNYNAATSIDQNLVVGKADQAITFGTLAAKGAGDAAFQLTATASSGLPITYASSNPAVAQVTGSTVTIVGIGTSTITAFQAGNDIYDPATPVPQVLTIVKSDQVWSATLPVTAGYSNDFILDLTLSSGLTYTVTSSNPLIASVSAQGNSWKISPLALGSTTLTASQAGNAQFNAAPTITSTLVVGKGVQGITFEPIPLLKVGDPAFLIFATSAGGQPVTIDPIDELNPSVHLIETTATPLRAKTTTITARANGTDLYLPAVVTKDITVGKGTQLVFFEPLPEKAMGDAPFDIDASTSLPYIAPPPVLTSSNPLVATISGKTVTIVGKGTTTITASSPSDASYNAAAPVSRTLVVRDAHSITFGDVPAKTLGDADFTVTATSSAGLPVSFTSGDPAVASVTGNTVKINGVGVTSITATAGDNTFVKVQVSRVLRVQNVSQTPLEQGQLWGITAGAGAQRIGEIFKTNGDGTGYKLVKEFKSTEGGAFPLSSLNLASNGRLYGTTREGGTFNYGTIFEFDPSTAVLTKTRDLTNQEQPIRNWVANGDGKLYGAYGRTMFEYDVATNTFTKTRELTGIVNSVSDVIRTANGKIYGVGISGPQGDKVKFFEYDVATNNAIAMAEFPSPNVASSSGLVEVNGKIYGTAPYSGTTAPGELIEFDPASNTVTSKFTFGTGGLGTGACGLVRASNGKLYGLTLLGGANSAGSLYEFDPATGTVTVKHHFKAGGQPTTQMVLAPNGRLYGTENSGNAGGGLFEFDPATGGFVRKIIFTNETGKAVPGNMVVHNGKIYGAASRGGSSNAGTIFEYNYTTNTISKKADFVYAPDGARPMGKLTQHSNGKLYGVTAAGGANNDGTIFELDPQTGSFTKRYDFNGALTSISPEAPLTLGLNGKLYGSTRLQSDSNPFGRLFEFDPAGNTLRILRDLKVEDGHSPRSQVVQTADGKLWGATPVGGADFKGTLYEFDPVTLVHTRKVNFTSSTGYNAVGAPVLGSNGKLYGFTTAGGDNGQGVIYEYDRATSTYAAKYHFSNSSGTGVQSTPVEVNGKLYGVAELGGANELGTLFEYDIASGTYVKKYDFIATLGSYPRGSLLKAANGKLYGMTNQGGSPGGGVVFEYDIVANTVTKKSDLPFHYLGIENASLTQTHKSFRKDQTIVFQSIAAKVLGAAPFTPDATASSGLSVVFSFESDKVTLSGATVTMVKAGSVTLKANQPGDVDFNPAPQVTQTFCINPAKPTITVDAPNPDIITLTSSASAGNQWFKNGSAIGTATGVVFNPLEAGTYSVQVTVEGCVSEMSANVPVIVTGIQKEQTIAMYPNPASETLYIVCSEADGVQREVAIYDMMGRRVFEGSMTSGELAIDVRPLVLGNYILKVTNGETATQKRFVRN